MIRNATAVARTCQGERIVGKKDRLNMGDWGKRDKDLSATEESHTSPAFQPQLPDEVAQQNPGHPLTGSVFQIPEAARCRVNYLPFQGIVSLG
ncbi:hypothetical protein CEXT_712061 [Caerostris extrusa]|uniref:Uncharacterized protein n=1 Tax=Caerostris extrusa TaxID=172846 RepID=A0AAV4SAW7_CAEEX|nr:hypothetical protein CEXT_712061 [Caerostris extrusa]